MRSVSPAVRWRVPFLLTWSRDVVIFFENPHLFRKCNSDCSAAWPPTREIISQAAKSVGSYSSETFEMVFNPDVHQHHVKHAETEVSLRLQLRAF